MPFDCFRPARAGRTPRRRRACVILVLTLGLVLPAVLVRPGPARAWNSPGTAPEQVCDRAARVAARAHGVPVDVMLAITRTETGRRRDGRLAPWPWTVNMEGAGRWFDSRDAALAYVFDHFKRGARSFDVGCFQINFKWHGHAFRSVEDMFDPASNADYAARFLARLHDELGDWRAAAGAYHSRTPSNAKIYTQRFDQIRAGLSEAVAGATGAPRAAMAEAAGGAPAVSRGAGGALIGAGATRLGSLVPTGGAAARALIPLGGE